LADDDPVVLTMLDAQLRSAFDCVGAAVDADEAVAFAETYTPEIAILDVNMPGGGGARATREIHARSPNTAIVILSVGETREGVIELMRLGAVMFLHKGIDGDALIDALTTAIEAHRTISEEQALEQEVEQEVPVWSATGSDSPSSSAPGQSWDAEHHGSVAHALVDALNDRDADALIALFHPVAEFRPIRLAGSQRVFEGREGVRGYTDELRQSQVDQRLRIHKIRSVNAEQFVAFIEILVGDEVVSPGAVHVLLAAGKIIEATVYLSDEKTLTALGLVPSAEPEPEPSDADQRPASADRLRSAEGERIAGDLRVLAVDDDEISRLGAVGLLERLGVVVDVASGGRDAIRMSSRWPYSAIFMDCGMPEVDGYSATRQIRHREGARRHTAVIAMTTHPRGVCVASGMDYYMEKPLRIEVLRPLCESLGLLPLDRARLDELVDLVLNTPLLEPSILTAIAAQDSGRAAALAANFLEHATARLPELCRADDEGDGDRFFRIARDLDRRASAVGGARIAGLCNRWCHAANRGDTVYAARIAPELRQALVDTAPAFEAYLDGITSGH
jgi:CheY-like chemotaxis protein